MKRRDFFRKTGSGFAGVTAACMPAALIPAGSVSAGGRMSPKKDIQETHVKIREFRTLGRTGFKVSDIGFGASFLSNANVMQAAMDMGINYYDSGEHYGRGRSETTIGEALKGRDRKSVFITTKLNLTFNSGTSKELIKERFAKCLERMQTDYADCLMIHMCTLDQVGHEAFHAAADELKSEGRVKFLGLSNHGPEQRIYGNLTDPMEKVLAAAVEDGRYDVVLVVYNFLQKEQGEKILEACATKQMGVTLMKTNPVNVYKRWKEGLDRAIESGREIPERVTKMGEEYRDFVAKAEAFKTKYGLKTEEQVRDAAIKFVLSHPGVHSVCPSINDFDTLETFVKLSGQTLRTADASLLGDYQKSLGRFYCRHACNACEGSCSKGVPVNTILRYNHYFEAQHMEKYAMVKYAELPRSNAKACLDCNGACEAACPHGVPVQTLLFSAHQNLSLV